MDAQDVQSWAQGQVGGGEAAADAAGGEPAAGAEDVGETEEVIPLPELAENVLALRDSISQSIKDLDNASEFSDLLESWEELAAKLTETGAALAEEAAQAEEDTAAEGE